jgi:uncharacterized damage-inducible protein DinB
MGKVDNIKHFARMSLNRLDNTTKNLSKEQLDWKSCSEANTVRNILGHLVGEWYGFIPKIVAGSKDAEVEGYAGTEGKSLEQIKADYEAGKANLMKTLDGISDEDLAKEMEWFMGKQSTANYLMLGVSEILHHEGQIAAILGVEKRIKGL